jgi:hypothetical protein
VDTPRLCCWTGRGAEGAASQRMRSFGIGGGAYEALPWRCHERDRGPERVDGGGVRIERGGVEEKIPTAELQYVALSRLLEHSFLRAWRESVPRGHGRSHSL